MTQNSVANRYTLGYVSEYVPINYIKYSSMERDTYPSCTD